MRTIKFRAQDIASNKWLFGDIRHHKNDVCIFEQGGNKGEQVKPETVGQFTGMLDKNSREIYEGDIVRHDENGKCYSIIYEEPMFRFAPNDDCFAFLNHPELLEVVGNIHDNKSLIEKGGKQ